MKDENVVVVPGPLGEINKYKIYNLVSTVIKHSEMRSGKYVFRTAKNVYLVGIILKTEGCGSVGDVTMKVHKITAFRMHDAGLFGTVSISFGFRIDFYSNHEVEVEINDPHTVPLLVVLQKEELS